MGTNLKLGDFFMNPLAKELNDILIKGNPHTHPKRGGKREGEKV
jgi:hypothetical protein